MPTKTPTTTSNVSQTKNPWSPTIDPLTNIVGKADALAGDVSNFTPIFGNATQQGVQGLQDVAQNMMTNGSGAYGALSQVVPGSTAGFNTGLGQLQNVASGGMLNANQYLDPVLKSSMDDVATKVNSQFTAGGRYGSGAHTDTLTRSLGELSNQARLANYNTERGAQDSAAKTLLAGGFTGAGFGGQLDASQLTPAQTMLQAGSLQDQMANAQRLAPMTALDWQAGITNPIAQQGGTSNGTSTSQTTQPTNWLTTGLGIGQMGLGLMSGNPMMMAGGAGSTLGGLSGGGMPSGWGQLGAF